ncbi:class I SAM-dependent methyltransferase [Kitasatospora saccharophila]|uniref:class I SAM-dependent methyltransferase n=1 Tax=Kitasatospora saccharophila TaxID=407973 RepID=UPI00363B370C
MPFDHNDHYHRLLLRQLPSGCRTALDVGCGTGRFARRLAASGIEVDALDPSAEAIEAARELTAAGAGGGPGDGAPNFRHADVTRSELPRAHYDFVSCLASLHHVPFDTVRALRKSLAPGGVLVVLGCYPEKSRTDWLWSLAAVPVNAVARALVALTERLRGTAPVGPGAVRAPVKPPTMTYAETAREAAVLLPGARVRRLLFWRYLLVYRAPVAAGDGNPAAPGGDGAGARARNGAEETVAAPEHRHDHDRDSTMTVTARLVATCAAPFPYARPDDGPSVEVTAGRRRLVQRGDAEVVVRELDRSDPARVVAETRFPTPWPRGVGQYAVAPAGDLAVFAGPYALRAVDPSGALRWEVRHRCWAGCDGHEADGEHLSSREHRYGGRGSVAFSADGALVWAHVRGPLVQDGPGAGRSTDEWLVLDATDGTVLARTETGTAAVGSFHVPHPDPQQMGLSLGEGQDGTPCGGAAGTAGPASRSTGSRTRISSCSRSALPATDC